MKPNPKREKLKELSAPFKALLKSGAIDTINEGLVEMYEQQGHTNLKTFYQWKQEGKKIRKGEHALLLWARPRQIHKPAEVKADPMQTASEQQEDEMNFFPICYVFSEKQIDA